MEHICVCMYIVCVCDWEDWMAILRKKRRTRGERLREGIGGVCTVKSQWFLCMEMSQ